MDFLKDNVSKFTGGADSGNQSQQPLPDQAPTQSGSNPQSSSATGGGMFGGIGDKMNAMAGGGKGSEKNEDYLDKGVDFFQEKFLGQGKQDNESAVEQAKDEQISDFIRDKYKSSTGSDFPIADKKTNLG